MDNSYDKVGNKQMKLQFETPFQGSQSIKMAFKEGTSKNDFNFWIVNLKMASKLTPIYNIGPVTAFNAVIIYHIYLQY